MKTWELLNTTYYFRNLFLGQKFSVKGGVSPPHRQIVIFFFQKNILNLSGFTTLFTNTAFLAHIGQIFSGSSLGPSKEGVGVCVQKSVTKVITKEIPSAEYEGTYKGAGAFHSAGQSKEG